MAAPKNGNVKEQILDAAVRLLQSEPDVSLAAIAKAAHVSKGTLFYYYPSRADVYLDIAGRYWQRLSDDLLRWVDDPEKVTTPRRLARYTMQFGVFDESGPLRLHLFADAIARPDADDDLRAALIQQYAHFKNILKSRIEARMPGADGENLAWMLLALVDGLMVQNALHNDALDIPAFIEWLSGSFPAASAKDP